MPPEAGDYEIRYVISQDRTILATAPITVTEVSATVSAAGSAIAGSELVVQWEGPDYQNDYISVAKTGARGKPAGSLSVHQARLAPEAADARRSGHLRDPLYPEQWAKKSLRARHLR